MHRSWLNKKRRIDWCLHQNTYSATPAHSLASAVPPNAGAMIVFWSAEELIAICAYVALKQGFTFSPTKWHLTSNTRLKFIEVVR